MIEDDLLIRVIRIRHHNVHIGLRRALRINRVRLAIKILVNDVLVGLAVAVGILVQNDLLVRIVGSGTTTFTLG